MGLRNTPAADRVVTRTVDRRVLLAGAVAAFGAAALPMEKALAAGPTPLTGRPKRQWHPKPTTSTTNATAAGTPSPTTTTATSTSSTTTMAGYPNATNTGHTSLRSALRPSSGFNTTADGQVIEGLDITGTIGVLHKNVTIRNCRIQATGTYCISVRNSGTQLQDLTLVGNGTSGLACVGIQDAGQYVMRRCDLSGTMQGLYFDNYCELYDNYLHDIVYQSGAHCDQMLSTQTPPVGVIIKHNTIKLHLTQTTLCWVGDSRVGAYEILFEDNWLAGSGYALYAGNGTGKGIRVINNKFSTEYYPECGYWGTCTGWVTSGNTWSGNVWADGPKAGQAVVPG
jgi:hypothetical protein